MGIVKFGDVVERINIKVDQSNPQLNYMEHGRRIIIPIKYYVGGEHIEGSEFMVHKKALIQGSTIGYQFQFGFRKGDILFMTKNPHLRKASMVDFDGLCSIATFVIASKSNNLLQNYLLLEMQSDRFWQYCEDNKSGGVNYFINWGTLSNYEFDLPPIEKQKELADKLWAAYRLKEGYKRLLAAIDEMVKSQFIEMFGNPLSPIQKWPIVRLGDYCIVNPTRPKGISDEMEVSFIPMQDVYDDGACNKFINRRYAEVKKGFTYCADGDVIFAKITPCMENGKGAELQGLTNAMGMGSTEFHVLRPISGKSISTWLYHFTKLDIIRKDAAKNMTGTGGQKRVPASYFDNFKIGVPSIDEQMNFAAFANQADKSKFGDFKSQFIEMFKNIPSVKIADCCITVSGGTPNTKKIEYYDGGDIPWLSSGEINQGYIFSTDKYITQLGLENSSAKWVPANSVVIAMYGATAGKVGFIKIPLTTNQAVCTLLPNDGFEPLYLYYATLSKTSWMISQCRGAAQPNISQSIIRSMEIPMATIDEQKRFCKLLTQADKSKSYVWIALKNLESMLGYYIWQVA